MSPSYWAVILTAERNPPAERHLPDLLINPTAFVFQALFSFLPICAEPTFQSQTDDVLQQTVAFNTASWSLNVFVTHAMPVLRQYWWMLPWGSAEIAQEPLWWGQSSLWGDQSEQWAEIPKPGGTAHSTQHTARRGHAGTPPLLFAMGLQHQLEKREPFGFTHTAFNHLFATWRGSIPLICFRFYITVFHADIWVQPTVKTIALLSSFPQGRQNSCEGHGSRIADFLQASIWSKSKTIIHKHRVHKGSFSLLTPASSHCFPEPAVT